MSRKPRHARVAENRIQEYTVIAKLVVESLATMAAHLGWQEKYWPWQALNPTERQAWVNTVIHAIEHEFNIVQDHEKWCNLMRKEGWKWGPIKDPDLKTHPHIIEYDSLPQEVQIAQSFAYRIITIAKELL